MNNYSHLPVLERRRILALQCNRKRLRTQHIRDAARAAGFASVSAAERGVNRVNRWDCKKASWNTIPYVPKEKHCFFESKEQLQIEQEVSSSLSASAYDVESLTEKLNLRVLNRLSAKHNEAISRVENELKLYQSLLRERIHMTQEESLSQEMGMVDSYEGETLKIRRSMERRGCIRKVKSIQQIHEDTLRRLQDKAAEVRLTCEMESNRETIRELHVLRSTGRCAAHLKVSVRQSKLCEVILRQLRNSNKLQLARLGLLRDQLRAVTMSICDNPFVDTLDLAENHIGDTGCASIGKLLFQSFSLKHLNLSRVNISTKGADLLFTILAEGRNQSLEWLNLSGNHLGSGTRVEVKALCSTVKRYFGRVASGLKHLDLSYNQLDESVATVLGKVLEGTRQAGGGGERVKRSTLSNSDDNHKLVSATAFALQAQKQSAEQGRASLPPVAPDSEAGRAHTAPARWNLVEVQDPFPWPPPMDYDGSEVESVASRRTATPNGQERIWGLALGDMVLAGAEERPVSSQGINVQSTGATKRAGNKKGSETTVPCPLEHLNLYYNRIGTSGARKLVKGLSAAQQGVGHNLRELDVGMNNIQDRFVVDLSNLLLKDKVLKVVRVGDNPLTPQGIQTLGVSLSSNSTLCHLDLAGTTLSHSAVAVLLAGLATNTTVEVLSFSKASPMEAFRTFPASVLDTIAREIGRTQPPEQDNTFIHHLRGEVLMVTSMAAWLSKLNAEFHTSSYERQQLIVPQVLPGTPQGRVFGNPEKVNVMQPFIEAARPVEDDECVPGLECMAELNHSTHSLWYTVKVEYISRNENDNAMKHVEVSLVDFPCQDVVRVELKNLRIVEPEIAIVEMWNDPKFDKVLNRVTKTRQCNNSWDVTTDAHTWLDVAKANERVRKFSLLIPLSMLPPALQETGSSFSMCMCPIQERGHLSPSNSGSTKPNGNIAVPNVLSPVEHTDFDSSQLQELGQLSPFCKALDQNLASLVFRNSGLEEFVVLSSSSQTASKNLNSLLVKWPQELLPESWTPKQGLAFEFFQQNNHNRENVAKLRILARAYYSDLVEL